MKFEVFNRTLMRTVRDEDGNECVFDNHMDAVRCMENVNETKKLNPRHKDDEITVRPRDL